VRVSPLEPRRRLPVEEGAIRTLVWTERVILFAIGVLLFVGALALLVHVAMDVGPIFTSDDVIGQTTVFLDLILLTLMLVELAYTVMLSLRGAMLAAEPFLIVGLIAVIRRILVITVGHVKQSNNSGAASPQSLLELGVLSGVILAFVISIVLLRRNQSRRTEDREAL
jgi:uncharacterized membrane protein (DUF373 family)